jgi:hypothetical protein
MVSVSSLILQDFLVRIPAGGRHFLCLNAPEWPIPSAVCAERVGSARFCTWVPEFTPSKLALRAPGISCFLEPCPVSDHQTPFPVLAQSIPFLFNHL